MIDFVVERASHLSVTYPEISVKYKKKYPAKVLLVKCIPQLVAVLFIPVGIIAPIVLARKTIQSGSWEACPGLELSLVGAYLGFVLGGSNCVFLPLFIHFDNEKKKRNRCTVLRL